MSKAIHPNFIHGYILQNESEDGASMQSENDGNEDGDIGGAGDGSDGDSDGNANPEDNEHVFF